MINRFLKNPPDTLFDECARMLYGDMFFAEMLAIELNVNPRTVERWANGHRGVPPFVWPILVELLAEKTRLLIIRQRDLEDRIRREEYPQRDPVGVS